MAGDMALDTLEVLQNLENKSKEQFNEAEEERREEEEIRKLKQKLTKLQQKKKWLEQQLQKECPLQRVDVNKIDSLDAEEKSKLLETALEAKHKKLEEMMLLHRLTGVSVSQFKQDSIRICWDTAYRGEFFEAYYAEIRQTNEKLTVKHHSLPYFLPVSSLISRHLNSDLSVFVEIVSKYLNVFVEKRQEALNAEQEFGLYMSKQISASPSYDVIEFSLKPSTVSGKLRIQLYYHDLLLPLPGDVQVEWKGGEGVLSREDILNVKQIFLSKSLCRALDELVTKV